MKHMVNREPVRFQVPLALFAFGALLLAGCGGGEDESSMMPLPSRGGKSQPDLLPMPLVMAGVDVAEPKEDATRVEQLVRGRTFATRRDPFALMPEERVFENEQSGYRVFSMLGSFPAMFTPREEQFEPEEQRFEPQPNRRLAGVLVGDSVVALLETQGGQAQLIKPGDQIMGTDWIVYSIDKEKAVLRRSGNVYPTEIVVRLESKPVNPIPQPRPGNPNFPPGTPPGMPPGMFPPGMFPPGEFPPGYTE